MLGYLRKTSAITEGCLNEESRIFVYITTLRRFKQFWLLGLSLCHPMIQLWPLDLGRGRGKSIFQMTLMGRHLSKVSQDLWP